MKAQRPRHIHRAVAYPVLLLVFLGCTTVVAAPGVPHRGESATGEDGPDLVVFLVVDQLRGDLLDRYSSAFTGGIRRLMDKGLVFSNAHFQHAATETSPGHAALSTGTHPARAGIPSNVWREGEGSERHAIYNVVDPQEGLLGVPGVPGASPRVLRRSGVADWVRKANPEAKVLSVSAKDRAAVLMAGQGKGDVYWFDSQVGRFVTSTFYRSTYPPWAVRFNEREMRSFRADSVWRSTIPQEVAALSVPDTASFEGDGIHTFFPHFYHQERIDPQTDDFFLWFEGTPMLDRATLDFSIRAMAEGGLGQSPGRTDFLSISFSQTDRIGHAYGPLSREQMDNLLRLDGLLGELFSFLDQTVGPENYVVGLTGDHGTMSNPERMEPAGTRLSDVHRVQLEQALSRAAREANARRDPGPAKAMVETLGELSFVGPAFTHDQLREGEPRDTFTAMFRNSFVSDRAGGLISIYGVEMWWAENVVGWGLPYGTTHGSPFVYDRWVPLILMGPGIEVGRVARPVLPLDLAPTLAGLAGIAVPDDLDGKSLVGGEN